MESMYRGAAELDAFHLWYVNLHGYVATAVCLFGILANLLNIIVLTRRSMISATNCILTGLAVSDGLTMAAYLPFALRFYVLYGTGSTPERNSLNATRFMLFYACFSVVVHTVSIWLTVTLAIFRYIFIRYPRHGAEWCSLSRAKLSIFFVNAVTLVVCIPNFIIYTVRSQPIPDAVSSIHEYSAHSAANHSIRHIHTFTHEASLVVNANFIASPNKELVMDPVTEQPVIWFVEFRAETAVDVALKIFNFWIQAIVVKLVPCIGLTILSILLVRTMKEAEQRRINLRASSCKPKELDLSGNARNRKTNRTTRMLLVVVALFLITEFPQGILNLLSGVLDSKFVLEVYNPLGDFMDLLALVNNGINFILYCTMSKQFRQTFIQLFVHRTCNRPALEKGGEFTAVGLELRSMIDER